jgi:hypothetical protein
LAFGNSDEKIEETTIAVVDYHPQGEVVWTVRL